MSNWSAEVVALNGKHYRASVDRVKRRIIFNGDIRIGPTDIVIVEGMPKPVDIVQYDKRYTVVTIGG